MIFAGIIIARLWYNVFLWKPQTTKG